MARVAASASSMVVPATKRRESRWPIHVVSAAERRDLLSEREMKAALSNGAPGWSVMNAYKGTYFFNTKPGENLDLKPQNLSVAFPGISSIASHLGLIELIHLNWSTFATVLLFRR